MEKRIVYPRPQWLRMREDAAFALAPGVPVLAAGGSRAEAGQLQRWLREDHGLELPIDEPAEGCPGILIGRLGDEAVAAHCRRHGLRGDPRAGVPEGYLLSVDEGGAVVAGHDEAGTFYGLQLLRQLAAREGDRVLVAGAEAHDWPHKRLRGAHIYMPGREHLPFFRRLLECMAALRYNTIFLEVGGGMRYDRHPEINRGWEEYVARATVQPGSVSRAEHGYAWPKNSTHYELGGGSFLEKEQVRQIVGWARDLHIEVIPEVQSLSHSYYLCYPHPEIAEKADDPFPDTYCPSNPASYELLFDVMDEVIEVFRPRIIHTGHDETYLYGLCPRCRGKSGAELIAGDINRIHDYLAGKGIRMAMWGDKLMDIIVGGRPKGGREIRILAGTWFNGTTEFVMGETFPAVDVVPKDILILNWYWGVDPAAEEYFGGKGFEQIFGNLGWQGRRAFTGWDRKSSPDHVLGAEVSTWCEVSEWAYGHDACIFNLLYSAAPMWWRHYTDDEREQTLRHVAALQPRLRDRLGDRRSPSRTAGARFLPLPVGDACNLDAPYARELEGARELDGIPFVFGGTAGNAIRVDREAPEAQAIPVSGRAESLLFLHHCCCQRTYHSTWDGLYIVLPTPEGVLGWYRVSYQDGSYEDVEIQYGENIANWDVHFGGDIASCCYWAEPVWEGRDEEGRPVTLYRYEWANPHPERTIAAVQMRSAGGEGEVRLLAVTGVEAG